MDSKRYGFFRCTLLLGIAHCATFFDGFSQGQWEVKTDVQLLSHGGPAVGLAWISGKHWSLELMTGFGNNYASIYNTTNTLDSAISAQGSTWVLLPKDGAALSGLKRKGLATQLWYKYFLFDEYADSRFYVTLLLNNSFQFLPASLREQYPVNNFDAYQSWHSARLGLGPGYKFVIRDHWVIDLNYVMLPDWAQIKRSSDSFNNLRLQLGYRFGKQPADGQ